MCIQKQGVATIRAYNQESRFMEILLKRMEINNIAVIIQNTSNRWLGITLVCINRWASLFSTLIWIENTKNVTFFFVPFLKDYLGSVIVFISIVTALFTAKMYPEATTPSLVALAINYTLLIPIYLNWVVKLGADLEMYIGAVERISLYINSDDKSTSYSDIDESPCELMAIKPTEKCEYICVCM